MRTIATRSILIELKLLSSCSMCCSISFIYRDVCRLRQSSETRILSIGSFRYFSISVYSEHALNSKDACSNFWWFDNSKMAKSFNAGSYRCKKKFFRKPTGFVKTILPRASTLVDKACFWLFCVNLNKNSCLPKVKLWYSADTNTNACSQLTR